MTYTKGKKDLAAAVTAIVAVFLSNIIAPDAATAGGFRVSPIMLDLGNAVKSGVIAVTNDGREKINLQIKALEWTQDKDGKDVYAATPDIIYFPKMMTIEKDERRVIRVGIKGPAQEREKTYRLFIEELPGPKKSAAGPSIGVLLRFGAPIFVKPSREVVKGEIAHAELSAGRVKAVVRNTGNVFFRVTTVTFTGKNEAGKEVCSTELKGWYLLNGVSRSYESLIPQDVCAALSLIEVEIKADKLTLHGQVDVKKEMCRQ